MSERKKERGRRASRDRGQRKELERERERECTCMLLNQTVAERSHRVGPAHTGIIAVFDDLET